MKGFEAFCHNPMEQEKKQVPNDAEEQNAIRKYLLGTLSDKVKMREIEENLLANDDFAERLSAAENELVEDYLDSRLTESENRRFTEFFLFSGHGKQKPRLTQNLRKYAAQNKTKAVKENTEKKIGFWDWRFLPATVRFAAVILLAAGTVFGVWRMFFYQSDVEKGLAQLRAAYSGQRPTESRISADLDYAPLSVPRGEKPPAANQSALIRAGSYFSSALEDPRDAGAHHALGMFYLTQGKFDDALREFDLALDLEPDNAKFNNDLSALYFEKAKLDEEGGQSGEVMEALALALKSVNRALEIDNSLLEALFNKALILQKMQVITQAGEAWEKYLERDSSSRWAEEGRKQLDLLRQKQQEPKDKSQILQDFFEAYREGDNEAAWKVASQTKELITGVMVQSQLTRKFLEADTNGRKEEADEILSALAYLGELEKQKAGDLYFSELADYYQNTDQVQRGKLLDAQQKLEEGHQLIKDTKFTQALEVLTNAKKMFISAGDLWESSVAEYQISYSLSRIDRIKESNEKSLALSNFAEQKNYKWLQVLADGWVGGTYFLIGESSKAVLYDERALKLAEEISDNYNIHRILVQLMEIYRSVGEPHQALLYTFRNLALPDSYHIFPRQKWRDLNYATEILYRFKFYDAAVAFGEESVNFARHVAQDNWMLRTSRRNLALIYGELKKYPEAYAQVELTLQLSRTFPEESQRKRLVANSFQILADLQRQTNRCAEAIENYKLAIQAYQEMEFEVFKYDAVKGRLLCQIDQQNDAAVREEFNALLQMFDKERREIKKEEDRLAFFDAEQGVYDAAINYVYTNLKDSEQAFNHAENSRARSLLNLLRGNAELSEPLSLSEVRGRIPPGIQIIYYAVLADKILIWQISAARLMVIEKPVRPAELNDKVREYSELLTKSNDAEKIKEAAKELYGILIEPVESTLEADKSICIVADKILYRVPFSSLISPRTNKYLIEDYALLFAPSATIFIDETEIARQREAVQNETVLSVGNPAFSRKEYPKLEDLPSAKREAEEIVRFYDLSTSKVFVEKNAVKERIVENLNDSDVVNFAGHYVLNSKSPALSKLLLASSELTIEEIMQKKLSRPRLMVLSACDTGVEKFYNGEGMIGAARAFLASGVPLTVASQWSVDSSATADLMINFHRYRKVQGLTTIDALRQAQIDMLSAADSPYRQPYYWAGFLPVGGYANY